MTRAVVARLDSLGDVVLAGPAVRAIAAGTDEVMMLAGPQGAPAARLLPGVDRVAVWECPWIVNPPAQVSGESMAALEEVVRGFRPDVAVILTSFHQSPLPLALLLRQFGVDRIAGASVDYPGSLLDVRLKPGEDLDEDQPEARRALAIACAAGFRLPDGDDGDLRVIRTPDVSHLVGTGPYLVLHPGASAPARQWPPGHSAAAVRMLTEAGHRVVVTGGPGERDLTAAVAGVHGLDLGGRASIPELSGVIAGATAIVVGNTGPAHLAAAVGTPVVSLFSPVVPSVRWAPYRVPRVLLGDQHAPCRGTRATSCPVTGHPCLSSVQPSDVVDAVAALVRATEPAGARA